MTKIPQPRLKNSLKTPAASEVKEQSAPIPPHPDEKARISAASKRVKRDVKAALSEKPPAPLSVSEFLNQLDPRLTPSEIEKLKSLIDSYDQSALNAKEIDNNVEIKPIEEFLALLSPERVREILKFNLPIFSICSKNSFPEKVTNINKHKKYTDADGNPQEDITFFNNAKTPHIEISTPTKNTIGVVDAVAHMPHLPNIYDRSAFSHRKKDIENSLKSRGLQLMNVHQALTFQQQTLGISSLHNNNPDLIADFYRQGTDTVSCVGDEHLPQYTENESYITYVSFSASSRMIRVNAAPPKSTGAHLRGRPFMLILEY